MAADEGVEGAASARFRFHHSVEVRFRDLDPMGHAHHSMPLIYLEEARARYWREIVGRTGLDGIDYVMAEITVRYHRRIEFPQTITVALHTNRVGGKSLEQQFEIRSATGDLLASGRTISVMYDYAAGASKPVPDNVRERIAQYEGDN